MKAASALMTERGFTLIELMVTVGVVAILAGRDPELQQHDSKWQAIIRVQRPDQ